MPGTTGVGLQLVFMCAGPEGRASGHIGLEPESEGSTSAPGCTGEGLSLGLWVQATRMVGGWELQ